MIQKAMEYIRNLRDIETFDFFGHKYTNKQIVKVPEDEPNFFSTRSLASLIALIRKESYHHKLNDLIVHVESPTQVYVVSTLRDDLDRYELYTANAELPKIPFGSFIDLESMNVLLKSAFLSGGDRDNVVAILGNIQEENIQTATDDGFTQKVVAKTGIATVSNVAIEPIVKLAPYRTFVEVDQPTSEFLLRLRSGGQAALFEADGGAWKIQARKNIRDYFDFALVDLIESGKIIVTE